MKTAHPILFLLLTLSVPYRSIAQGGGNNSGQGGGPPTADTTAVDSLETQVYWEDLQNVSYNEQTGMLTKTGADGWMHSGAVGKNILESGRDGYISYKIPALQREYTLGLSSIQKVENHRNADYAFLVEDKTLSIIESGTVVKQVNGNLKATDELKIERTGNEIRYLKNGQMLKATPTNPSFELRPQAGLNKKGEMMPKVRTHIAAQPRMNMEATDANCITGILGKLFITIDLDPNQHRIQSFLIQNLTTGQIYHNIIFITPHIEIEVTDLFPGDYLATLEIRQESISGSSVKTLERKATIRASTLDVKSHEGMKEKPGGGLVKEKPDGWGNAGLETRPIVSPGQDGKFSYRVAPFDGEMAIGMGSTSHNNHFNSIEYTFFISGQGLSIMESGQLKSHTPGIKEGDMLTMERQGNIIRYKKNDLVLKESMTDPTKELKVQASLFKQNSIARPILIANCFDTPDPRIQYFAISNGNWTDPATWSTESHTSTVNTGTYPGPSDWVSIKDHSITVNSEAAADVIIADDPKVFNTQINIENGGILTTRLLSFFSGISAMQVGGAGGDKSLKLILQGNGQLNVTERFSLNKRAGVGDVLINAADQSRVTIGKQLSLSYDDGTKGIGVTLSGNSEMFAGNMLLFTSNLAGKKKISVTASDNAKIKTSGDIVFNSVQGAAGINLNGNSTLEIGGNFFRNNNSGSLNMDLAGNTTVIYNGTGDQLLAKDQFPGTTDKFTYNNVTLSKPSGSIVAEGEVSVNGVLNLGQNDLYINDYKLSILNSSVNAIARNNSFIRPGFQGMLFRTTASLNEYEFAFKADNGKKLKITLKPGISSQQGFSFGTSSGDDLKLEFFPGSGITQPQLIEINMAGIAGTDLKLQAGINSSQVITTVTALDPITGTYRSLSLSDYSITGGVTLQINSLWKIIENLFSATCTSSVRKNTVHSWLFDGNGSIFSERNAFSDLLGRNEQILIKDFSGNRVLGSQALFDEFGRGTLQSLLAPTYQQNIFCFDNNFMLNNSATKGTLRWYYSDNNDEEPYVADDTYPYSQIEFCPDPLGRVKRISGVGVNHRLGSGHETKAFYMGEAGELEYMYGFEGMQINGLDIRESGDFGNICISIPPKDIGTARKNITIDEQGGESVTFSDNSGTVFASCFSGLTSNCVRQRVKNKLVYNGQRFADIHLPLETKNTLKLKVNAPPFWDPDITAYSPIVIYSILDLRTNTLLVQGTDYTINSASRIVTFMGQYASQSNFLRISFEYNENFKNFIVNDWFYQHSVPPCFFEDQEIEYELDYSQWNINFFDDAGRLVESVQPEGIDCNTYDPVARPNTTSYVSPYDVHTDAAGFKFNGVDGTMPYDIPNFNYTISPPGVNLDHEITYTIEPLPSGTLMAVDNHDNCLVSIVAPASKLAPPPPEDSLLYILIECGVDVYNPDGTKNFDLSECDYCIVGDNSYQSKNQATAHAKALCGDGGMQLKYINFKADYDGIDWPGADPGKYCAKCGDNLPCLQEAPVLYGRYRYGVNVYGVKSDGTQTLVSNGTEYLYGTLNYRQCNCTLLWDPASMVSVTGTIPKTTIGQYVSLIVKLVSVEVQPYNAGTFNSFTTANPIHTYIKGLNFKITWEDNSFPSLPSAAPNHLMKSDYEYNDLGWLLSNQTPDEGKTEYVYNEKGWLRFSQNAVQRTGNRFSYSNYDRQGRVVEVGEFTSYSGVKGDGTGNLIFQNQNELPILVYSTTDPFGSIHLALNESDGLDDSYCSDQRFISYDLPDPAFPSSTFPDYKQNFLLGKVSKTHNEEQTTWYSYDELGRLKWMVQHIDELNKYITVNYTYDFNGNVLMAAFQKELAAESFYHHYIYDENLRLEKVLTSTDGVVANAQQQANYIYYQHGPLKRAEYGTVQGMDYVYTINGWLKSINHPGSSEAIGSGKGSECNNINHDPGQDGTVNSGFSKDVFGMAIDYFTGDYSRSNDFFDEGIDTDIDNFNGNMKSIRWKTQSGSGQTSSTQQMYSFKYDALNQLTEAVFGNFAPCVVTSFNTDGTPAQIGPAEKTPSEDYKMWGITYDRNGNLLSMNRNAYFSPAQIDVIGSTPTTRDMDAFAYNYATDGSGRRINNRLLHLTDNNDNAKPNIWQDIKHQSAGNFNYSAIGEITADASENNYSTYDVYGRVTGVFADASHAVPKARFVYNDRGSRLKKLSYNPTGALASETWYMSDASGNVLGIYEKPVGGSLAQSELPLYGMTRLGNFNRQNNSSAFEITDHLGNVRAVVSSEKTSTTLFSNTFDSGTNGWTALSGAVSVSNDAQRLKVSTQFLGMGAIKTFTTVAGKVYTVSFDFENSAGMAEFAVFDGITNSSANKIHSTILAEVSPASSSAINFIALSNTTSICFLSASSNGSSSISYIDNVQVSALPQAQVLSYNDYYPWGMVMPGKSFIGSPQYRYSFQGQEKDEETRWNAFELRMYDGRKARWDAPDLFRQYHSPYLAMGNNPMRFIDPLGGQDEPAPQTGANDPIYAALGIIDPFSVGGSLSPQYSNEEDYLADQEQKYQMGEAGYSPGISITAYKKVWETTIGTDKYKVKRPVTTIYPGRRTSSSQFSASIGMDRRFAGIEEGSGPLDNTYPRPWSSNPYIESGDFWNGLLYDLGTAWEKLNPGDKPGVVSGSPDLIGGVGGKAFKIGQMAKGTLSFEAQLAKRGILGFAEHGKKQMIARGFTNEAVLKIIKEGAVKDVVYKGQAQIHYILGNYRIATAVTGQNAGKVISIMGDYNTIGPGGIRGIFTGF